MRLDDWWISRPLANTRDAARLSSAPGTLRPRGTPDGPAEGPADDVDDLVDVLIGLASRGRRAHATLNVVLEDEDRQRVDGGPQGARLLEDVDAVLLALDHPADAADLALDPGEPAHQLRLVTRVAVAEMVGVGVVGGLGGRHRIGDDTPGEYPPQAIPPRAVEGRTEYTPGWMDPLDHLVTLPDGLRCTVCDEAVPGTMVRLLARRDDLAFLQIDCPSCSSATLGFVLGGRAEEPSPPPGERPISADDVLDMHELLSTWRGGLTGLLARDDPGPADSSR